MPRVKFAVNKEARPVYPTYSSGDIIRLPDYKPKLGGELLEFSVRPYDDPSSLTSSTDFNCGLSFRPEDTPVGSAAIVTLVVRWSIERYVNSRVDFCSAQTLPQESRDRGSCLRVPRLATSDNRYVLWSDLQIFLGAKNSSPPEWVVRWPVYDDFVNRAMTLVSDHCYNSVKVGDNSIDSTLGMLSIRNGSYGMQRTYDATVKTTLTVAKALNSSAYNYNIVNDVTPHTTTYSLSYKEVWAIKNTFRERLEKLVAAAKAFENLNLLRTDTKKDIGAVRRNMACISCLKALVEAPDDAAVDALITDPTFVYNAVLPWYNYRWGANYFKELKSTYNHNTEWGGNHLYEFFTKKWGGKHQLAVATGMQVYTVK